LNKWLNHIRTELHEIYGESYPRFLKAELIVFASYPLSVLLLFLSIQPYMIRTVDSWGMVGIIVIVISFMIYIEKRYKVKLNQEMEQKYKQTTYYRWINRGLIVVLSILMILTMSMLTDWVNQPQPIPQAVTDYGYPVYLPTKLPFKPTNQDAIVKASPFYYEMDVYYENGDSLLNLIISQDDDEDLSLVNATLKNGTKANYEEFDDIKYDLTWYQNGFRYELSYSPSKDGPIPNKDVLLNIANSFKPVHP
jgi:hypothetical protein